METYSFQIFKTFGIQDFLMNIFRLVFFITSRFAVFLTMGRGEMDLVTQYFKF